MSDETSEFVRADSEIQNTDRPQLVIPIRISTSGLDEPINILTIKTLALIDTGASRTCIGISLLNAIGAEPWLPRRQRTASGVVDIYQRYASLELFADKVCFAEFLDNEVLEYQTHEDDPYQVLLGMDVLRKFKSFKMQGFDMTFEL
jgi:predicted aspartyl protease